MAVASERSTAASTSARSASDAPEMTLATAGALASAAYVGPWVTQSAWVATP